MKRAIVVPFEAIDTSVKDCPHTSAGLDPDLVEIQDEDKLVYECRECGRGVYESEVKKHPVTAKQCPECGTMRKQ